MELRSFPARTIPADADFAIQIDGNSMEPFYRDGQIVWIKRTPELSPGDVGLFIVDDEGFIKVYEEEEPEENEMDEYADSDGRIRPKIVLISYNEEYPPRYISPNTRFEIVGKVVG
jgi:repressor LexA